jgi:hypothetical protein
MATLFDVYQYLYGEWWVVSPLPRTLWRRIKSDCELRWSKCMPMNAVAEIWSGPSDPFDQGRQGRR